MELSIDPLVAALAGLVLLFAVLWLRARTAVGRGNARRGAVARAAEAEAEDLLERHGFVILGRQVSRDWPMDIDGERVLAKLRADLLVRFEGADYVAEVKSGVESTRPTSPGTRRQLLEYLLAFEVEGVVLVDMQDRRLLFVEFPMIDVHD
ncbi:MAG: hypothetical protein KDA24_26225 [Deltaproteobacteria bacterium]|nr:hypothetical protein [Deltaproteobacteria bacterium]